MDKHVNTPLKRVLFERGIKSKWLAEQLDVNESGLSQIVNGKRIPTLPIAIRIARVLGVSVEELWGYVVGGIDEAEDNV